MPGMLRREKPSSEALSKKGAENILSLEESPLKGSTAGLCILKSPPTT